MAHSNLKPLEGKYEILEKLAEGGMGAVYKVHHRLLEEVRVIKVIRPQLDTDDESRQRFLREARSAVRLRHPNIALLHDFTIADDGTSYMVMEFIDGVNLVDLVRQSGQPTVSLVLEVGMQALRALGYLHKRHFVHRDISPDNIMLARDVEGNRLVKLIDLGIAKPLESDASLTSAGLFLGKVRYASPEHFGGVNGDATVEPRSDLYSFGIVLYVLLTGKYPIQGKDHAALMAGHLFHPPISFEASDPDGRVPEELRAIVLRSLAKQPSERFSAADEFAAALVAVRDTWRESEMDPDVIASTVVAPMSLPTHGSTQDELDGHFRAEPTPTPFSLKPTTATTSPPVVPPSATQPTISTPPPPPPAVPTEPVPSPAASSSTAPPAPPGVAAAVPTVTEPPSSTPTPTSTSKTRSPRSIVPIAAAAATLLGVAILALLFILQRQIAARSAGVPAGPRGEVAGVAAPPADAQSPGRTAEEALAHDRGLDGEGAPDGSVAAANVADGGDATEAVIGIDERSPTAAAPTPAPIDRAAAAPAARRPNTAAGADSKPSAGRDRDLDTVAAALVANANDGAAAQRGKELMESSRQRLFAARSRAQTASAARLATTAFDSAKLLQRDGESHEMAGRWIDAARAFRDSAAIFVRAAEEAEQRRAGRPPGAQASAASGEERAVLEAIEAYAQSQRRRSLSGQQLQSVDSRFTGAVEVRIDRCSVTLEGTRASARCRMRQGYPGAAGGPAGQDVEQQVVLQLVKTGSRWIVEQTTPVG